MRDDQRNDGTEAEFEAVAPSQNPQDPTILEQGTYAGDHAQRNDVEPNRNAAELDEDNSAATEDDSPKR